MTKISQLSSIGDSLAVGDQFVIRDIDDGTTPNKSVTVSGITRALDVGTAAAPAIAFATDKNTGIYSPGADQLGITTGGTVRLTTTTTGITSALPVDVPLGTASAPTVTFTGDLNTGIYSPGADQVAISTNGTGRLFVDASGRVGVGTTPSTVLHCSSTDAVLTLQGTRGTGATASIGTGGTNSQNLVITAGTDLYQRGATHLFQNVAGTTEYARITSAGLVGVGTSSPNSPFEVGTAGINLDGAIAALPAAGADSAAFIARTASTGSAPFDQAGSIIYRPRVSSTAGRSSHIFYTGSPSTIRMVIDETGKVGIGTSSPLTPLHVAGSNGITVTTGSNNARIYGATTNQLGFTFATSDGVTVSPAKAILALISDNTSSRAQFLIGQTHSATTPSYSFIDDSNTGIVGGAVADVLGINTGGVRALTVDASQRVGIGTTSPSKTLHVYSSSFTFPARIETNGTGSGIELKDGTTGANPPTVGAIGDSFYVTTSNTERARIDSSGRLLVGTSSAPSNGELLRVTKASSGTEGAAINLFGEYSLADDASQTITLPHAALIMVTDQTTGRAGLLFATYDSATITTVSDPSNIIATSDTDTKLCVFKSAGTNNITVKNRLGAARNIGVGKITIL